VRTGEAPDDDVDLLIDRWGELLPELDLTPLDVMSRLRRASSHASLAAWEFDVLAALRRASAPLSAGALVAATNITSAAMTNRLDKLTERRLIDRVRDPGDRRAVLVSLREEGARRVDAAMAELVRLEAEELSDFSRTELAELARLLRPLT
jgi:DNA-binding MarR family transcriptional regulator